MNDLFTIGDFCFRLCFPERMVPPANFMKFQGGTEPVYEYTVALSSDFPAPEGRVLTRREDILVTGKDGLECRYIGVRGQEKPYACYQEINEAAAHILLDPERTRSLNIDPVFCSLLALERRQARFGAMVLHCAYVEYEGEAILFSAPSETGKTTQANLWERHRGAKTVNGDRCLLQKIGGTWIARGWPVCGSSGVCHNKDLPVRSIVMLSQAPEDRVSVLSPANAFTQIYSQITVNRWNRKDNLETMDRIEDLIRSVPVLHLACTMNERAVIVLEEALFPERKNDHE